MINAARLVRNSFYVLGAQGSIAAINAVYAVALARWLGPEAFGIYTVVSALLWSLAGISEEGLAVSITRAIARAPDQASSRLSNGLVLAAGLGVASSVIMGLLAVLLGYPSSVLALVPLAALALWLRSPWAVLVGGLNAHQHFGASSTLMISVSLLNAGFGLAFVITGWGLAGVFAAGVLANAATLALAAWIAHRLLPPLSPSLLNLSAIRQITNDSTSFSTRALLAMVYTRADTVLLSVLVGFEAAGLYRSASKVYELAIMLPGALNQALFPLFSALHGGSREQLKSVLVRQSMYLAVIGLPLAAVLAWLAHPLVLLVYGPEYEASAPVLAVLAVAILLYYLKTPLAGAATSGDRQGRVTALAALWVAANVVLNLALIPQLGALGAALASVGAAVLEAVGLFLLVRATPRSTAPTGTNNPV